MTSITPVPGVSYAACARPNPTGNLAVCCLWAPVEREATRFPEAAIVGPCVAPAGVGLIVRTLLANPQICFLFVTGPDLSGTRAAIERILSPQPAASLDAARVAAGLQDVPASAVATLWVLPGMADGAGEWDWLALARIEGVLVRLNPHRAAQLYPVPTPNADERATRRGPPARTYVGETLWTVWPRLLGDIAAHGAESETAAGVKQRELLAASWTFSAKATLASRVPAWVDARFVGPAPEIRWDRIDFDADMPEEDREEWEDATGWGVEAYRDGTWHVREGGDYADNTLGDFPSRDAAKAAVEAWAAAQGPGYLALERYARQHFTDREEKPEGVEYVYRDRLVSRGADQLTACIAALIEDSESRKAVAVTWDVGETPGLDALLRGGFWRYPDARAKNPPCLVQLWFRRDADGSLYTHATFRSHDILRAGLPNAWGLCRLAEEIAGVLEWPLGRLTIASLSAHVYADGWALARELGAAHGRHHFENDDRAILRVRYGRPGEVDNAEIGQYLVDLLHPDGRVAATLMGATPEGAEAKVLRAGWVTTLSHAAWLGRELVRAGGVR